MSLDEHGAPLPAARQHLVASCYYHRGTMAHYLCDHCGRALCDSHRHKCETEDRCPDCLSASPPEWWICGRCGRLTPAATGACLECGSREAPMPRLPREEAYWEKQYRSRSLEATPWVLGVVWLIAFVLGLFPLVAAAMRTPEYAGRWLLYLLVMSLATGVVAAMIVRNRSAFTLILNSEGVELQWRHRAYSLQASWSDILGLELSRTMFTAQFRLLAPLCVLPVERSCRGYREAVTSIRQRAAVAPAPFRAW